MVAVFEALGSGFYQTATLANSGSALSNHQVRLAVTSSNAHFWANLAGGASATGSDIRILDVSDVELPYWIERLDTSAQIAWIWVKVPTIAMSSNATLRVYYGDTTLPAKSDLDAVMVYGDEFAGNAVDPGKWTVSDATGWSQSGGQLHATSTTGRLSSRTSFGTGVVIESRFRATNVGGNGFMVNGLRAPGATTGFGQLVHPAIPDYFVWNGTGWSGGFTYAPGNYSTDWTRSTITVVGGTSNTARFERWSDGATPANYTNTVAYTPTADVVMLGKRYDDANTGQTVAGDWDFLYVRKYTSSQPTLALNSDPLAGSARRVLTASVANPTQTGTSGNDTPATALGLGDLSPATAVGEVWTGTTAGAQDYVAALWSEAPDYGGAA